MKTKVQDAYMLTDDNQYNFNSRLSELIIEGYQPKGNIKVSVVKTLTSLMRYTILLVKYV